jgi:uncharacterized membrane protein YfcA
MKNSKIFAGIIGVLGGFASMIGNAAGGIFSTYFVSLELQKHTFIGTTAITFFLLNVFKLPFHIFVWKTITLNSFLIDLCTIPGILIGGFLGAKMALKSKPKNLKYLFAGTQFVASVIMIINVLS